MIWFYLIISIIVLLCPNTTIAANSSSYSSSSSSSSIGNILNRSCFQKEKEALLLFKASIVDPDDGQLSTWTPEEDDDCCIWSGVTCNNKTGHVTELDLSSYDLEGEISPSLLNLTYLNHLDLSFNYFNVTIPNFIASMTQLRYLNLGDNNFYGTIPWSIGSLTQLRYLDLSMNSYLNGTIPSEFGNLTSLESLSLGLGAYVERPCTIENIDWLSNLSNLQHLDMTRISLAKANYWVDVILSLPKLSFLNLEGCNLSEVVHPYSSFLNSSSSSSIQFLHLYNNNLNSSMYRWLFPLTSNRLVSLDLSYNMLDGIPKYLGNLCNLTSLSFNHNSGVVNFTEFLSNLSGCTSVTLQELHASYNELTGSLSDEIQKFSSLNSLELSNNNLNGTMSEKVWELPNLQRLDASFNSLSGHIVENNGKSKFLYINLSKNSLKLIPSKAHILNLSYVVYLDLSDNKLGPLFPKWIQTPKNLSHLDIANTGISDIPVEFWKLWPSQLTYLNLSSNNISGEVSDLSSNFGLRPTIDLSSNKFHGPILKVPPTLILLNLSKNKFNGGISFLCQIVDGSLSFLDLTHNSFTGQLPDCLWHFNALKVLNLGHNNFSGRIPASIGYLVQLEVLDLYNNNLSGELPLALKNCKQLSFLNLGANKLSGNVPIWIGENLTLLYGLILRSNNFFGLIPLQLCHLTNLQILDLSMNNLNGTIPPCVNSLNSMVMGKPFLGGVNKHTYGLGVIGPLYPSTGSYVDNAMIGWQGNEHEFSSNLGLLMSIDLSSNNLTGEIPNEFSDLHKLLALNLSKNALFGEIPRKIGEMKELLSLDLSRNTFSGGIPSSMTQMTFLSYLDMSHNNLSGRIPSSTQLQSFELTKYTGNAGLCGPPLTKSCPGDEVPPAASKSESREEGTDEVERWFYIGGGIGFAIGFWIACGTLLVNRRGRHAFFPFVDFSKDWVYVKVMVYIRKLQRV